MKTLKKKQKKKISIWSNNEKTDLAYKYYYILAAAFPLLLLTVIYACHGMYPFGDHTYLRVDFYHQYAPFAREFCERLRNSDSLLYGWNLGLGGNYLALYAYYLASPSNFLLLFVPNSLILEALNSQIFFKCAISAVSFAFYLERKCHKHGFTELAFTYVYAMSAFFLAYAGNIIWLDNMALVPLVLWSLEKLIRTKKCRWYLLTMGLCIFSNFYMAFILGIFLVLWFIVQCIVTPKFTFKNWAGALGRFAVCTIYLLLLCSVILLPMVFALKQTQAGDGDFPDKLECYFSFIELFQRMYVNVELNLLGNEVPNIYSSVVVILLIPFYFFNPGIKIRNRITYGILLLFMLLSFNLNVLDYVWHGLHFPNNFPAREGGVFVFLCVIMAYEAYIKREKLNRFVQLGISGVMVALFAVGWVFNPESENSYGLEVYITTGCLLLAYSSLLLLERFSTNKLKRVVAIVLLGLMTAEICVNVGVTGFTSTVTRSGYQKYARELDGIIEDCDSENASFYRMDKLDGQTSNDSSWNKYYGCSYFSSTVDYGIKEYCSRLGMRTSSVSYSHEGASPFMDMLFSIKYLVAEDERKMSDTAITRKEAVKENADDKDDKKDKKKKKKEPTNQLYLYENEYVLPMGFMIEGDGETAYEITKGDPFMTQNSLAKALTGEDIKVFEKMNSHLELRNDSEEDTDEAVNEAINPDEENANESQELYDRTIYIWEDTRLFVFVNTYTKKVKVIIDDGEEVKEKEYDDIKFKYIIDLGDLKEGTVVRVTPVDDDEATTVDLKAYKLNPEALEEVYSTLSVNTFTPEICEKETVKGTFSVDKSGSLLLSIPYDEGWSANIDGKEVEIQSFKEALILLPVTEGTHNIEMSYRPKGFVEGLLITGGSILLGMVYLFLKRRKG